MEENFEAFLWANNKSIELNPFVNEFLSRTVIGATSSLEGAADIQSLEFYLKQGDVTIFVNEKEIPLTHFPNDVIANTIVGLVSSLKGVDKVESLRISVKVF